MLRTRIRIDFLASCLQPLSYLAPYYIALYVLVRPILLSACHSYVVSVRVVSHLVLLSDGFSPLYGYVVCLLM